MKRVPHTVLDGRADSDLLRADVDAANDLARKYRHQDFL
jgi:hypothetical protein